MPAPPTEPPVAARAFGPLGSKLPEGPRNASSRRPTRQRAFNWAMRRLETIQTVAQTGRRAGSKCRSNSSPPAAHGAAGNGAAADSRRRDADPGEPGAYVRFRSLGRCRLLSLRQLFASGRYPDHAAQNRTLLQIGFGLRQTLSCRRQLELSFRGECLCPSSLAPCPEWSAIKQGDCPVNQRKQIRNTNEHFAKSFRNMPLG